MTGVRRSSAPHSISCHPASHKKNFGGELHRGPLNITMRRDKIGGNFMAGGPLYTVDQYKYSFDGSLPALSGSGSVSIVGSFTLNFDRNSTFAYGGSTNFKVDQYTFQSKSETWTEQFNIESHSAARVRFPMKASGWYSRFRAMEDSLIALIPPSTQKQF
jgi:hypothetical protein